MYKLFNRVGFGFSKSYDLAVIGAGPGGTTLVIKDTSLPSKLLNWDSTLSASKREEPWEVPALMSDVFPPRLSLTSPTSTTNSIMTSRILVSTSPVPLLTGQKLNRLRPES